MYSIKLNNEEALILENVLENIKIEGEKINAILVRIDKNIELKIYDDKSAEELSNRIKDFLVLKGFNLDYSHNDIGVICENLVDKFYEIGW